MTAPKTFAPTDRPKRRDGCHIRDMAGERIVYEPKTRELAVLNATASFIFDLCDGERTTASMLDALLARYEAPRELLERDLKLALEDLARRELID